MGSCFSSDKVEPHDVESKERNGVRSPGMVSTASLVSTDGIVSTKHRSCTDAFFLILMALFTISLVGLIIYCALNGDISRIINGYDSCGNVCGVVTERDPNFPCKGEDYTNFPFLLIREAGRVDVNTVNLHRECVQDCPDEQGVYPLLNRCVPKKTNEVVNNVFSKTGLSDFLAEASEDLELCWREILYMSLLALLFSVIIMILFRFIAGIIIWLVLALVAIAGIAGTIYLWVRWDMLRNQKTEDEFGNALEETDVDKRTVTAYLAFAIVATIVTVIILLIILVMRKRIKLVAQLFKEAGKALSSMPLLLAKPFLTFIVLSLFAAIWLVFSLLIESSGFLHENGNEDYEYKKDDAMKFTRWYNLIGLLWFCQFSIANQQMVVAGAVAKWFFTRNKDNLGYPILTSFRNLVRFHLGTTAFGSLIIAIIQIIRIIFVLIEKISSNGENAVSKFISKCCQCCLACFENILQYLSRNAYIMTAMRGYPFCKAGKNAFMLLATNALRVAAINSVGDFVLILAKLLIVQATVLSGFEMLKGNEAIQHMWLPLVVGGLIAFFIGHAFISVYEMIIDTIFLCFCEDCKQNDGLGRPYFMSRGLMEFVENSKKALSIYDAERTSSSGKSRSK